MAAELMEKHWLRTTLLFSPENSRHLFLALAPTNGGGLSNRLAGGVLRHYFVFMNCHLISFVVTFQVSLHFTSPSLGFTFIILQMEHFCFS